MKVSNTNHPERRNMIFCADEENGIVGDPRYDTLVNTIYAVIVIIAFIISGLLNPALFWFHFSRPSTILTILLRILNVVDFATTTILCPYLVYGLLIPIPLPHQVPATLGQRLYSAVFAFILFMSVSTTTIMTATRAYSIKCPLKVMRRKSAIDHPMMVLMGLALLITSINFYFNETWDRFLFSTNRLKLVLFKLGTGQIDNWPELAFGGLLMTIAMGGIVCAAITGREIYKSRTRTKTINTRKRAQTQQKMYRRSCVTILMLSGGIQTAVVLVCIQFLYSIFVRDGFPYHANYFFYANGLFCSLVLSVVNPFITAARSTGFKKFVMKKLRGESADSNTTKSKGFGLTQRLTLGKLCDRTSVPKGLNGGRERTPS